MPTHRLVEQIQGQSSEPIGFCLVFHCQQGTTRIKRPTDNHASAAQLPPEVRATNRLETDDGKQDQHGYPVKQVSTKNGAAVR
ncbi:hypothetical protein, partial [Rhodopirellula sp. UBA1907]